MLQLSSADVSEEYARWRKEVGEGDPYSGPPSLGIHDVLKAHFLIADFFFDLGEGIGGFGPRNLDLLHSALYRQHTSFGGVKKWKLPLEICATLFFGLIKDHPFHDANKRTAFLTALYHLEVLGLCPTIDQKEFEDFTVLVADRKLNNYSRYRQNYEGEADGEVKFIADYLRRNTREIDKRYYTITYRQLDTILRRFGYELANPRHNHIDVVRREERRKIFGMFGEKELVDVKVAQIGFPGWTRQVGQGAIKTVRQETKLNYANGVDSKTFFGGADPINCLITQYQEPLRRLARR